MAILGGSPLGLINVTSAPSKTGTTTFGSAQKSGSNVNDYNVSGKYTPNFDNQEGPEDNTKFKGNKSIFSGSRTFRPWPSISRNISDEKDLGDVVGVDESNPSKFHSNSIYDTSILNIIQQLNGTKAALKPADFAYLKNVGVYPNNRLMVARRMWNPSSSVNNLMKNGQPPLVTLISWVPPDQDFISVEFGEIWGEAEADFTGVLNDLGNDVTKGSDIGSIMGAGFNAVPLPGFTEIIQRQLLKKIGVLSEGSDSYIPAGNPNLIKEAKMRQTIGYSQPGSGLKGTFKVDMTCEYEQKFISGLDPTLVWLDIIAMALRFGTSNSQTYGLSPGASEEIKGYANDPWSLVDKIIDGITSAINTFSDEIKKLLLAASDPDKGSATTTPAKKETPDEKITREKKVTTAIASIKSKGIEVLTKAVEKYKERIVGIVNALSGMPSTPWHITIGNPMRPVFVSGDMLATDVKLTLGPTLAFNDLPSSIKIVFSLSPARNLGLQELFAKFNAGYLRTVTYKGLKPTLYTDKKRNEYTEPEPIDKNPEIGKQKNDDDKKDGPTKTTGEVKPTEVKPEANSSAAATPGSSASTVGASASITPTAVGASASAVAPAAIPSTPVSGASASVVKPVVSSTGTTDRTLAGSDNQSIINSDANSNVTNFLA